MGEEGRRARALRRPAAGEGRRRSAAGARCAWAGARSAARCRGRRRSRSQPFGDDGLFAGLAPPAEVLVNQQVLADPAALGPDVKVWARLKDGTPLVTAAKRGDGQLVFFHVTANSDWSNLPLSGLFVEMLRRIASLGKLGGGGARRWSATARAAIGRAATPKCWRRCRCSTASACSRTRRRPRRRIAAAKIADAKPSAENPPGYYGPAGAPRALNLMTPKSLLKPLPALPLGRRAARLRGRHGRSR